VVVGSSCTVSSSNFNALSLIHLDQRLGQAKLCVRIGGLQFNGLVYSW